MSLNHLSTQTYENKWANPYFNTLKVKNSTEVGNLVDDGLTANKLVETDGLKQLVSSSSSSNDFLNKSIFWGDGSDGNVTLLGGSTILLRDMYYDTLTLNSGVSIFTNGYKIFAKTAITGDGTGIIEGNGADAIGQTGGVSRTNGLLQFRYGTSSAGINGGAINTAASSSGATSSGPCGSGGLGGQSDTKVTNANGILGNLVNVGIYKNIFFSASGQITGGASTGGAGNGGSAHTGGGGGASSIRLFISAKTFGNVLSVQCKGGNGGNASGATGGIGSGAGGGFVYLQYQTLVNFNPVTQIDVNGGTNGTVGVTTGSTASQPGTYFLQQIT